MRFLPFAVLPPTTLWSRYYLTALAGRLRQRGEACASTEIASKTEDVFLAMTDSLTLNCKL